MLEGVGDCPVQGYGSGLGGPATRAAIGGSLPCRGEGAAPFGGGAGGPDTTQVGIDQRSAILRHRLRVRVVRLAGRRHHPGT